jgi:hypothetical protein
MNGGMSAFGTKRTYRDFALHMSAFDPKRTSQVSFFCKVGLTRYVASAAIAAAFFYLKVLSATCIGRIPDLLSIFIKNQV